MRPFPDKRAHLQVDGQETAEDHRHLGLEGNAEGRGLAGRGAEPAGNYAQTDRCPGDGASGIPPRGTFTVAYRPASIAPMRR